MLTKTVRRAFGAKSLPQFDHVPPKYTGPSYEKCLEMRHANISNCMSPFYQHPLMLVHGRMQYVYDQDGKRYLDCFAGASTSGMGHCHPRITAKIKEQLDRIQHVSAAYMNDEHCLYAHELAEKLPDGLDTIYFTSSGSESSVMVTQFARLATGNFPIFTLQNGYHGMGGTAHLTHMPSYNYDLPKTQGVEKLPFPDTFRGAHGNDGKKWAHEVKNTIDYCTPGKVAVFLAESVMGAGGIHTLPDGYMKEAVKHVRAAGGLYCADEVQTGFGRIGEHFWGFDLHDVKPDMVSMAKQMGNGFPLSAVAMSKEVASAIAPKITFTTYGANPMAMAAGREVLRVIEEEKLQQNCKQMGDLLIAGLRDIKTRYKQIGDVRGKGLMIGVELVHDTETGNMDPNPALFAKIFEKSKENGILMGKGGRGNIFRFQPQMCLTKEDVEFALDAFERSLKEYC